MQSDFEKMVEKYKDELMRYHMEHPGAGEWAPQPAPKPEIPQTTDTPEMPEILPGEPLQAPAPDAVPPMFSEDVPPSLDPFAQAGDADVGYLQVQAVTAEGAMPVAGATVTVTDPKSGQLLHKMLTDMDGNTPTVALKTVDRNASETPDGSTPYDTYTVEVFADRYYSVKNEDVPIFGGVTNLQTVSLIPLPEFVPQGEGYTLDTPGFDL